MEKLPLGLDISKATIDYYAPEGNQEWKKGKIDNTTKSIEKYLSSFNPKEVFLVAEPTGTYSDKLFELAHSHGFELRLANPKKSSQFTEVLGIINKTDENAAQVLVEMGLKLNLPLYNPPTEMMKERKQIQMTISSLSKQCQMLENQIHALNQRLKPSQVALQALKSSLENLREQKQMLEEELQELTDEEIKEFTEYAGTVTGVGPKSTNLLLIYTDGLKYFDNKRQLSKFVGVVPATHQSGSSVYKKGKITKSGPAELRACLYNAAKSAKRYNQACKALYERLRRKGKSHKVAMIAVVNKLLHQIFAVVKSKTAFDNNLYLTQQK